VKDLKTIVAECRKVDFTTRKAAIATVVRVRGSSYRSPGARMLITDDGRWVGSISGGCLEGDALRKARQVMMRKLPMTVTYDTREESNQNLGIGLGCNGVIDVLIEPVDLQDAANPIAFFESILRMNVPVALATVFDGNQKTCIGNKLLITPGNSAIHNIVDELLVHPVTRDLLDVFESKKSEVKEYTLNETEAHVFVELIQPAVSLIIFGGGFDARPVSQLAKSLGWEVMITDECVAHIAPIFFPDADRLSLCQRNYIDRDFTITPYTACVLMSHNYEYDRDVLKKLINTETPYIGILGPRKRFDKMLKEFSELGVEVSREDHHRIHSPIGLDIGAEAPDEIAVSIIAEIQSKFTNRSGGFLKYRTGPIHHRDTKSDQVFKEVFIHSSPSRSAQG